MTERYITDDEYAFDVREHPPPLGVKAYFIGRNGIGSITIYNPEWHVAWKPLPKLKASTKHWMSQMWTKNPTGKVNEMPYF